jgi:hypothetical protein
VIPEPAWWGYIDAWRVLHEPRRLPVVVRKAMLEAEAAEHYAVWRWLQTSVG